MPLYLSYITDKSGRKPVASLRGTFGGRRKAVAGLQDTFGRGRNTAATLRDIFGRSRHSAVDLRGSFGHGRHSAVAQRGSFGRGRHPPVALQGTLAAMQLDKEGKLGKIKLNSIGYLGLRSGSCSTMKFRCTPAADLCYP
jgi:hypothetical protein